MRKSFHFVIKLMILAGVVFGLSNTPGFAVNITPEFHNYSKKAVFEYFLNYPFSSYQDIKTIHDQLQFFPLLVKNFSDTVEPQDVLAKASAFTTTVPDNGEQISLVLFAQSNDKALKRLRNEIQLPPPKGGAIVRVYPSKDVMPFAIRALFQGSAQGITQGCRFIAINADNKSPDELDDIVSHELVHAYIASYLGVNNNRLPQWFNEGLALYLSSSKDQYIIPLGFNWLITSRVTEDYAEYHLIFAFLDYSLGRRGIAKLIRQAIRQQSIEVPLHDVMGLEDYNSLRDKALQWQSYQQNLSTFLFTVSLGMLFFFGGWALYRKQLRFRYLAQKQAELAKETAGFYDRQILQDVQQISKAITYENLGIISSKIKQNTEKKALVIIEEGRALRQLGQRQEAIKLFEQALQIAGWSSRVADAVQQARDEMDGIIV